MQSSRRERSRSPIRIDSVGRRREAKSQDAMVGSKTNEMTNVQTMNPMMMANMYPQGNMMMAGGMYPNMMMSGAMMGGGMMHSTGMEIMQSTGMDIVSQSPMDISSMGGQPITPSGGTMDMTMMGGMMVDPTMMGMYPSMGADMSAVQEKKEIVFKHCKLIPPESNAPQPPRRSRPPGCRTIFVGGLPDKIRESTVREIFETYGRIQTLRLSKKNFCHIRYDREECVDAAMFISGYGIKLSSKEEDSGDDEKSQTNSGWWLHVDYALSRDDQNDYERKQRQAMRVQQQQLQQLNVQQEMVKKTMNNYKRSPSPVRVQPFNNAAILQLSEKIKSEEHFPTSVPTLLIWLERGECSKKNSNQFYSMIQTTNSHIRRLFNEKIQAEEELQECKERVKNQIANVIEQLEQVAKVFAAASHQRVWDHFTKPQRKNIETWQKMTQEFKALKEEYNEKFCNEDEEFNGFGNRASDVNNEEIQHLKRENESLLFQLEAYKNEVDVIKLDAKKEMEKFKAQFIARQALQEAMEKNPPLPQPMVKPPPPPPLPNEPESNQILTEIMEVGCSEAKLIGIMSAFLQVHPRGAPLEAVAAYVRGLLPAAPAPAARRAVRHVLRAHPDVFAPRDRDNYWTFVAFHHAED